MNNNNNKPIRIDDGHDSHPIHLKSSYNIYMVYLHEDSQRKGKEE